MAVQLRHVGDASTTQTENLRGARSAAAKVFVEKRDWSSRRVDQQARIVTSSTDGSAGHTSVDTLRPAVGVAEGGYGKEEGGALPILELQA